MNTIPNPGRDSAGDDSAGWAFSDEEAARDAGLIPPDPSTHAAMSTIDPDDLTIPSSDQPTEDPDRPAEGGYGGPGDDDGRENEGINDETMTSPGANPGADSATGHVADVDADSAQPESARTSDGPNRTG